MGFKGAYEKALIAHGYAMGRSAKEIDEHINSGNRGLVAYQLVSVHRNLSPMQFTGESEIVLLTLNALYKFAMKMLADIRVVDDGETLVLSLKLPDGDGSYVATDYTFRRRVINSYTGTEWVVGSYVGKQC